MNIENRIKISIEQEKLENELSHKKYELENLNEEMAKENKQLKDNWNKLKDYIIKEYYMYLPLEASTKSITILIDKMKDLEGSDSNVND